MAATVWYSVATHTRVASHCRSEVVLGAAVWYWDPEQLRMPLQVRSLVSVAAMLSHSAPAVHVARSAQARSVVVVGAAVCHCESVHVEIVAQARSDVAVVAAVWY